MNAPDDKRDSLYLDPLWVAGCLEHRFRTDTTIEPPSATEKVEIAAAKLLREFASARSHVEPKSSHPWDNGGGGPLPDDRDAPPSTTEYIGHRIVEMIRYIGVKAGVADTVYGAMCHEVRSILRNAHLDYESPVSAIEDSPWNLVCPKCGASPEGPCGWPMNCPVGLNRADGTTEAGKS